MNEHVQTATAEATDEATTEPVDTHPEADQPSGGQPSADQPIAGQEAEAREQPDETQAVTQATDVAAKPTGEGTQSADATTQPAEQLTAPPRPATTPVSKPRTKLVCTIGPASGERIRELIGAGMDVARINFSHGTPDEHKRAVDTVRAAAHSVRRSVAVMVDLPGPKIRLGELAGGEAELEAGRQFILREPGNEPFAGSSESAEVSRAGLAGDLRGGDRILLADGAAELTVRETGDGVIRTEVVRGGLIRSRSGVNVPTERLSGPALTEADRAAVPRALQLKADMVAQSFVRSAADVTDLRALLGESGPPIVAKIETRQAVEAFDEIVEAADGVMIARGDLGVDLPFEEVPLVQKDLLRRARVAGRFTIVATQMLESMTGAPRPTRAEASDVANAVLDGTDAVMLSAETAIGEYPVEAAAAALSISAATERQGHDALSFPLLQLPENDPQAIIQAAVELSARYPRLAALWCFTRSGQTAETLSALRPRLPVVAFTTTPVVARRLAVRSGVIPVVMPSARTGEPLIRRMEAAARAQRVARSGAGPQGSRVLLVTTSGAPGGINRLEIYEL